jgi:hypothetical protein
MCVCVCVWLTTQSLCGMGGATGGVTYLLTKVLRASAVALEHAV